MSDLYGFVFAFIRRRSQIWLASALLIRRSQVRALVGEPYVSVTITGYTDRLGSDEYNVELSQRRANDVKSYLVGKGVAADRLIAVGKGKVDPIVHCDNSARSALIKCLEPNRRVVIEPIPVERRVG